MYVFAQKAPPLRVVLRVWDGLQGGLDASLLVQHVPCAQHVHDTQSTVVQAVAGTDGAGAFAPQVTAVVRTDVAFVTALVVSLQDLQDAGLTVAVTVGSFGEVTVLEVLDVTDVSESDAVAVLTDNVGLTIIQKSEIQIKFF